MEGQDIAADLITIVPALLFLCAAVPLATLLDRLGFFEAAAARICEGRSDVPILALWVFAALTTASLNLDTTVVLLTPLYVRLAQRTQGDVFAVALIPLLLAAFASSILPVSNLTTIIASERLQLSVGDVLTHTALPSVAACILGWAIYRRLHPTRLSDPAGPPADRVALHRGGVVVGLVLVGFTIGPMFGVDPWMVALAADLVLAAKLRYLPIRHLPLATCAAVAALTVAVGALPGDLLTGVLDVDSPGALLGTSVAGVVSAVSVNNLPSALLAVNAVDGATWGFWAWLVAINTGAVLLPTGAVANVLWWRIMRTEGQRVTVRSYVRGVVPIAAPAVVLAAVTVVLQRMLFG